MAKPQKIMGLFDGQKIGQRIAQARAARGITSAGALASKLRELLNSKKTPGASQIDSTLTGSKISRQTVENWERGTTIPPWDKVALMAELFGAPYDEAWIMFERRAAQLEAEQPILTYITRAELRMLQHYRRTLPEGQQDAERYVQYIAEKHPLPPASIHQFRRRGDKP